jgi:hypothetical protein
MRLPLVALSAVAVCALVACSPAEAEVVRDEAKFVDLVRAAGGSSAEGYGDEELIAQGDELCAMAAEDDMPMSEFKDLAASMAEASGTSAATFVAVVASAASASLCA